MTPSDSQDTIEIRPADAAPGETPAAHLISWALTIIENAPRTLIGQEPTDEQHGERGDWLAARDMWRRAYQQWAASNRDQPAEPEPGDDEPSGDQPFALEPHVAPLTENERLIMHARVTATATGSPVRVVRRRVFGDSIDVQVGGLQMRADGAK